MSAERRGPSKPEEAITNAPKGVSKIMSEDCVYVYESRKKAYKPSPITISMPGIDQDGPSDTPPVIRRTPREKVNINVTVSFDSDN